MRRVTGAGLRGAVGAMEPAEPLWQRVPTRDEHGQLLSDFMMIIPGLRARPPHLIDRAVAAIEDVLLHYRRVVVFADLNLRLNVLWVSVRPRPGICLELPAAIALRVPEAKLVAHKSGR
ncbi:hypothetical protein [Sulfurifustis variabilis]|uniref:hypothetical protein n=1 Tax=Sulfurifustis variabilis TaxID=1675686 RepID=UPI000BBABB01|nr:hypothetical protein [Sulfurifustis variabilis]